MRSLIKTAEILSPVAPDTELTSFSRVSGDFLPPPTACDSICDHGHLKAQPHRALKGDSKERAEHHQVDHHQEHAASRAVICQLFEEPRGARLDRAT